jgi:hypothetical protein
MLYIIHICYNFKIMQNLKFDKIKALPTKNKKEGVFCSDFFWKVIRTPKNIGKSVLSSVVAALTLVTALRYNEWISHLIDNSSLKGHGDLISAVILTIVTVMVANVGGLLEEGAEKLAQNAMNQGIAQEYIDSILDRHRSGKLNQDHKVIGQYDLI